MRWITLIFFALLLLGCAPERFHEVMEIRDAPLEMKILTRSIKNTQTESLRRFEVGASVLEPERFRGKEIFLIVDGVPPNSSFLKVDVEWIIDFDEFSFASIEGAGLSFWNFDDLNPRNNYSKSGSEGH